jgi:hypothetical protein
VDLNIVTKEIINEHKEPIVEHGPPGSFFQDGVSLGNHYQASGKRYLTFMGWQNPVDGHWRGDIGRLIIRDDLSLEIASLTPFMTSDAIDPISLSYPWIYQTGSGEYDMWYGSTVSWNAGNGEMRHVLKHAHSLDGETFLKSSNEVPSEIGVAQAFSRPTLLQTNDGWEMWFSYRSGTGISYRIGHAYSLDGLDWTLSLNTKNLEVSPSGWDSEMIEYPYVFEHQGAIIMLYNGNGYGQSGFGMAILER